MSTGLTNRRPPAACTIVSRNYLTFARVLARSYLGHHPGARFYLFVIDELPAGVGPGAGVTLLGPPDLALPNFHELCFEYDVAELCTAVKPSLLQLLLGRFGEEEAIFFDPDILVTRPLAELGDALDRAAIVLTPNMLRPIPLDGMRPTDQDILLSGVHNLGFVAVRHSGQALDFLRWWEERLLDGGALVDVPSGLMTDQKWADLAPSLFPETALLRDDTYNVAWWNLHHRAVTREGDAFLVNGRPLAFFHFSGFEPSRPHVLTRENQNRFQLVPGSALADLFRRYADLNLEDGYAEVSRWHCGYSRLDNGVPVSLPLRRLYLSLDEEARGRFGDPFRTGPGSFLDWATRPQPEEGNLSPFLLSAFRLRYDLWCVFSDVRGADRDAFLDWAQTAGGRELKYDPAAMRVGECRAAGRNGSAPHAPADRDEEDRPLFAVGLGDHPSQAATALLLSSRTRRYLRDLRRVRAAARVALPPSAAVLVVSKGYEELVEVLRRDGRDARHFPPGEGGGYAGYHPADSAEAIRHLEELRGAGARYLLFPAPSLWWLEHYAGFREHLERNYRPLPGQKETCLIFALGEGGAQDQTGRRT